MENALEMAHALEAWSHTCPIQFAGAIVRTVLLRIVFVERTC